MTRVTAARIAVMLGQLALVAGFAAALRRDRFPLGVRGEWEWLRVSAAPPLPHLMIALIGLAAYTAFVGLGLRGLSQGPSRLREGLGLVGLSVAAVTVQLALTTGAPVGHGLAKWPIVTYDRGATGYYLIAKTEIDDVGRFLADYPKWIREQDALHVGTHPPGLFLVAEGLLRAMETWPGAARLVMDHAPDAVVSGVRIVEGAAPLPQADRASLVLTGALTWLACGLTVVPLYLLARVWLPPSWAWAAAALWPLVPSAVMFQPVADTFYPLLSTSALALAAWAGAGRGRWWAAIATGVVLSLGMLFTLAFLAVGLIVALVMMTGPGLSGNRRLRLILATGVGFLAPTLTFWAVTQANPFVIWWWNQANHARFYDEFPRTYTAWLVANPIELAVALGLPATIWGLLGLGAVRSSPRVAWATLAVLVLLSLMGRNLSEVARLWLPMMPMLLVASGAGLARLNGRAATLAATAALMGVQTLVLQATIQVVYPAT